MIYFIQAGRLGPIKIGHTNNGVEERLKELQTGSPDKLILIGIIEGDVKKEQELHKRFKNYRVRGEWFNNSPELDNYILKHIVKYKERHSFKDDIRTGVDLEQILQGIEQKYIIGALEMTGGKKSLTAQLLGMTMRSLRYKLEKYELYFH